MSRAKRNLHEKVYKNIERKMEQAMQATSSEELYEYLMDPSIPKTEAEHYAARRIEELEANQRTESYNALHVGITERNKRIEELEACLRTESEERDLLSKQHYRDRIDELETKLTLANNAGVLLKGENERLQRKHEALVDAVKYEVVVFAEGTRCECKDCYSCGLKRMAQNVLRALLKVDDE